MLIILGIIVGITIVVLLGVIWSVHLSMVRGDCNTYKLGTYKQFIIEYNKYPDWNRDSDFSKSYFGKEFLHNTFYIHADVIKFNDIGMVLDPFSYILFKIWETRNRLRTPKQYAGRW